NKNRIYTSTKLEENNDKKGIKKECDLALNKLKDVVEYIRLNKFYTFLKYGEGDVKKEALEYVKNNDNINKELKDELLKYEKNEGENKNVSKLINHVTPIFNKVIEKLVELRSELSKDLNKVLE
ncbi:sporozoite protein essential for cell traversal, partial [Hepatocystis sp. ex Piliocolobus tephrosceles]